MRDSNLEVENTYRCLLLEALVLHVKRMREHLASCDFWAYLPRRCFVCNAAGKICHPRSDIGVVNRGVVGHMESPGTSTAWQVSHRAFVSIREGKLTPLTARHSHPAASPHPFGRFWTTAHAMFRRQQACPRASAALPRA